MFGETDSYTSVIKYSVLNLQNLYSGKCLQNAESTEVFKEKKNIYIYIYIYSYSLWPLPIKHVFYILAERRYWLA